MSVLNFLQKACKGKQYRNYGDLAAGEYAVEKFEFKEIKDDKVLVKVNLEEFFVFLPEWISKGMTQEQLNQMNSEKLVLVYYGKDAENKNR